MTVVSQTAIGKGTYSLGDAGVGYKAGRGGVGQAGPRQVRAGRDVAFHDSLDLAIEIVALAPAHGVPQPEVERVGQAVKLAAVGVFLCEM